MFFGIHRRAKEEKKKMMVSKMTEDGRLVIRIGDHWIAENDAGEVFRRLKEITAGIYENEAEREKEIENVLNEYDAFKA
jgi:prefoldin subunit 5